MEWLITLVIGGGAVLFGVLFLRRHLLIIESIKQNRQLDENQVPLLLRFQYRRILTSCLVILIGILIPVCYYLLVSQDKPLLPTLAIFLLLLLTFAVVILALSDLVSGRFLQADLRLRKAETELKRQILENELQTQIKHRQGGQ